MSFSFFITRKVGNFYIKGFLKWYWFPAAKKLPSVCFTTLLYSNSVPFSHVELRWSMYQLPFWTWMIILYSVTNIWYLLFGTDLLRMKNLIWSSLDYSALTRILREFCYNWFWNYICYSMTQHLVMSQKLKLLKIS